MGLDIKKERQYIIYKYTSPSGGVYIGQTCNNINCRASSKGKGYLAINKETGEYLQPAIAHAILKYGWENFKKEILYTNLTSKEADNKEIELIKFYKEGGKCYNISSGGKGVPGTREHKIKQYSLKGNFIREWNSIKEAEEYLNKPRAQANIVACCQGKKHRAYGYVWRYSDDENNLEIQPLTPYRSPINQYNKNGDFIKTYPTIAEASRQTGIRDTSIGNCLRGWSKSAGGYVWKFVEP